VAHILQRSNRQGGAKPDGTADPAHGIGWSTPGEERSHGGEAQEGNRQTDMADGQAPGFASANASAATIEPAPPMTPAKQHSLDPHAARSIQHIPNRISGPEWCDRAGTIPLGTPSATKLAPGSIIAGQRLAA
jgi:hypothetical protein